jgi:hypothetical protein
MANTLYKAAVRELEAVLPPRLVAQSLHEGLSALGKTAETLERGDVETILRDRVLPRLTLSRGAGPAQATVQEMLGRLAQLPDEAPTPDLSNQAKAVQQLQEAAKPFNIYFEWSETQKLRAQLSLLEAEHAAGRDAGALIAAARAQLGVLQQKLDDQLAVQARELVILEAAREDSSRLGSPKVRRLAGLLELIRSAQEARQRAPAEVERAHKLAGELRAEKLRLLGEEARVVRTLEERFSTLLSLDPALAGQLAGYRQEVAEGMLLGETLGAFAKTLEDSEETLRHTLETEFRALAEAPGSAELAQLLTLSLKVLETTLPPASDVQRIRDLVRAGGEGAEQLADFHHLETEAGAYRGLPNAPGQALEVFLAAAREALERDHPLPKLAHGWNLLDQAKAEASRSTQSFAGRAAAARRAAGPLLNLNSEAATELRWRLQALAVQQEGAERVSPKRQAELEATLREAEALIASLQDDAAATHAVAAQLMQGDALGAVLGFLDASTLTPAVLQPDVLQSDTLQGWLERQAAHEGVAGLALFTESADTLVAGDLPTDARTLQRAVRLTKRRADTLGKELEGGAASSLTVETPGHTLVAFWLTRARSLVLVTPAPTWEGAARRHLEDALPELVTLLREAESSPSP